MPSIRTRRRRFLLAGWAWAVSAWGRGLRAQTPGIQVAELRDQLEKGLRARLPSELAFIARVVDLVERGQLSVELVKSTFQWARIRAKNRQYPFPYFERALRIRAARRGIEI